MAEIIIDDNNYTQFLSPVVNGEQKFTGLKPPSLEKYRMRAQLGGTFDIPLIPESQWQTCLDAQIAAKAQLSNIRNRSGPNGGPIPSRDQDSYGYCWCHSSTSAALLVRAVMHLPFADLSAFAVGCIIKDFANEGGWGEESLKFIADRGIPTSATWPQQGTKRSYDNPATWAEAAKYKFTTEWMALDGNNMKAQQVTCLLLGIPIVQDHNWWSHSICGMDLVSISPYRVRIWNSWGDSWSENGTGILESGKAIPDDALAPRVFFGS